MKHDQPHELAGKTVSATLRMGTPGNPEDRPVTLIIEDWWDRGYGESWMDSNNNPAAMAYGMRSGFRQLPLDDEVVYGKIGHMGHLVHVSELGEVKE